MTVAGQPEIFPVSFAVDDATVVFRTAEGTKLAAVAPGAARPPRAVSAQPTGNGRSASQALR